MNKYLEKIARYNFAEDLKHAYNMAPGATIGLGVGAGLGALDGASRHHYVYDKTKKYYVKKERTKVQRILGGIGGTLLGGWAGANIGNFIKPMKYHYGRHSGYHSGGGKAGNESTGRTIHDIHKDLGAGAAFKTKSEAKKHFRSMASKYHPDKHEGDKKAWANEQMAKINRAWDEYNAHPDGFTKLANAYLEKIAGIDVKKIKDIVSRNPGATVGGAIFGAEGLSSTTKKKHEHTSRYRLRQIKNTALGVGTGVVAGKVVQEGLKTVMK